MQGQGFYDDNGGLVFPGEIGVPGPSKGETVARTADRPITRTPLTSSFRKIGNPSPGWWNDIKTWWSKLPTWQKGAVIGVPVVAGIVIAASQKGEGKSSSVKRI